MDLQDLKIELKLLKEGLNKLSFDLDDAYFSAIEADEVSGGCVHVDIDITRVQEEFFSLEVHETGTVVVSCDVCLDPMDLSIEVHEHLEVKFGKENSEEDDLITVAENEGVLDVTWYLYEFLALNIPIKHVHAPGKCNSAMIRKINEYSAARSSEDVEKPMDPRWEALLKLKK